MQVRNSPLLIDGDGEQMLVLVGAGGAGVNYGPSPALVTTNAAAAGSTFTITAPFYVQSQDPLRASDLQLVTVAPTSSGSTVSSGGSLDWLDVTKAPYSAKGDGRVVTDGAITSGQTTLTSATANFTAADVGKLVSILGAGTAGKPLATTITAFTNATTVTVGTAAGATVTGATVSYGSDDTAAIQSAIDAASSAISVTKTVYWPSKIYTQASSLTPRAGVSYRGAGAGRTILKVIGTGTGNLHHFGPNAAFTQASPGTDMVFRDMELDGSTATVVDYTTGHAKGIYFAHLRRTKFIDLFIHDTSASGLGADFMYDGCEIRGCIVTGCGRENDGTQAGGSGIGIGTALTTTTEEPVLVAGCTVLGNKRYGIFVENQNGLSTNIASGARIVANYARSNQVGIGDSGNRRTVIVANSCTQNSVAGISFDNGTYANGFAGYEGLVADNQCYANTGAGIRLNLVNTQALSKITLRGNHSGFNTGQGLLIQLDVNGGAVLVIEGNRLHDNARSGLRATYAGTTNTAAIIQSEIVHNVIYNNGTSATVGDQDGIRIEMPLTDTRIVDNRCFDRQGTKTQGYGLVLSGATVTGGAITGNDVRNNLTGGANITATISTTTMFARNQGIVHRAPVAQTVSASPYTLAAGETEMEAWVNGGTVSSITVNGVAIGVTSGHVHLQPGESMVVTYSVLPTVVARRL